MKRTAVLAAAVFAMQTVAAQDVILTREAEEIEASIEEISDTEIRYRRYSQPDGPLRVIAVKDVFRIKYANGETEVFAVAESSAGSVADEGGAVYEVGDVYNENGLTGIVVHVDATGRHGLIISSVVIDDEDAKLWCSKKYSNQSMGAADEKDGMNNMLAIERVIEANSLSWDDFPAFGSCRALGEGWYLPAIKEVEYIVRATNGGLVNDAWDGYRLSEFNGKLTGAKLSVTDMILSSTESTAYADCVKCFGGSGRTTSTFVFSIVDLVPDYYAVVEWRKLKKRTSKDEFKVIPVHKF